MKIKRLAVLSLSLCLAVSATLPTAAAVSQEEIDSAASEKAETAYSLSQTEDNIAYLESLTGDLESYLTELNTQYQDLADELSELSKQSEQKQKQQKKLKSKLKKAKRQEAEQYAAMKMRISYMYENSDTSFLDILLSSKSFVDFLNRAEMMSQIADYDRNMLDEYRSIREKVSERKQKVEESQQEIEELQTQTAQKCEEIAALEAATQDQMSIYQDELDSEESEAGQLLALVNSQSDKLDQLIAQQEEEEAAEAAAAMEAEAAAEAEEQEAEAEEPEEVSEADPEEESDSDYEEEETYDSDSEADSSVQEEEVSEPIEEEAAEEETASSGQGTYLGNFKLTSYCSCAQCCGIANNYTASGTWPTEGRTVAMAGVPFGTQLLINGNVYTVEDRGTPYGHVDIYCSSHQAALAFGVQYADVYQLN